MNQRLTLPPQPVRIQLCGRFSVVVDGTSCEDAFPGRQGQRLFAYLVLYRQVHLERSQLVEAVGLNAAQGRRRRLVRAPLQAPGGAG